MTISTININDIIEQAKMEERAAIVGWLRDLANRCLSWPMDTEQHWAQDEWDAHVRDWHNSRHMAANHIEAGEHQSHKGEE